MILEVLRFLLAAAGPARDGAGAVDALLLRVPNAVAGFVHADPAVVPELQDAAFDRVHQTGEIILFGHVLEIGFHAFDGVFRLHALPVPQQGGVLLIPLVLIHPLVRLGDQGLEPIGIADRTVDVSQREIHAVILFDFRFPALQSIQFFAER